MPRAPLPIFIGVRNTRLVHLRVGFFLLARFGGGQKPFRVLLTHFTRTRRVGLILFFIGFAAVLLLILLLVLRLLFRRILQRLKRDAQIVFRIFVFRIGAQSIFIRFNGLFPFLLPE